jgi:hypothetical protein
MYLRLCFAVPVPEYQLCKADSLAATVRGF